MVGGAPYTICSMFAICSSSRARGWVVPSARPRVFFVGRIEAYRFEWMLMIQSKRASRRQPHIRFRMSVVPSLNSFCAFGPLQPAIHHWAPKRHCFCFVQKCTTVRQGRAQRTPLSSKGRAGRPGFFNTPGQLRPRESVSASQDCSIVALLSRPIVFLQKPNQIGHARAVGSVIGKTCLRIDLFGIRAAPLRAREKIDQLHVFARCARGCEPRIACAA